MNVGQGASVTVLSLSLHRLRLDHALTSQSRSRCVWDRFHGDRDRDWTRSRHQANELGSTTEKGKTFLGRGRGGWALGGGRNGSSALECMTAP